MHNISANSYSLCTKVSVGFSVDGIRTKIVLTLNLDSSDTNPCSRVQKVSHYVNEIVILFFFALLNIKILCSELIMSFENQGNLIIFCSTKILESLLPNQTFLVEYESITCQHTCTYCSWKIIDSGGTIGMYSYYRIYVIGTNSVVWTEVGTPCRATPCPHLFRFLFFHKY